ncbi:MAG: ribosome-associated translation inhibitor RaiA [Betaproteobacteria bacterium]|nr:ribosome-associated translation inhibitor RaiA [Betaproteobacteria bacterium]NBT75054.1 ribosome-associated translation inhibitor RaiA [Betaproteobacteria bacterium]NBY13336.1 ribosome-associated translation inhibitor RaiA [Betaproteobacteria bacterium]NCA16609.1 ribosome-associated translation inhibitor RaiA [Betaproteobacteria bacterium]NDF03520.1 ribosome-associated translation inhibitor RaiA [Betaproteobacteria bacterium]
MKVSITGHHLEVTPSLQSYVEQKLAKAWRHFGQGIQAHVVLGVEKLDQKAEVTVHFQGKDIHAEAVDTDLYTAIDLLADKLDRQVVRYKEQHTRTVHSGQHPPAAEASPRDS